MTTIIDDSIFRQYYPTQLATDTARLRAVITLTQMTNIRDLLGDSLYQYVIKFIDDGELESSPVNDIYEELKILHSMYTAIGLYTIYYDTDNEEDRDAKISYITGNARALELNIIKLVKDNPELLRVASLSKDNMFDEDKSNFNTLYYDE